LSVLHVCKIPVLIFLLFIYSFRKEHEANHKHEVVSFSGVTGISNVQQHLFKHHIGDWVKACDDLKIIIHGADARLAVQKFKNLPMPTDLEADRPEFSKDAFTDALAEFVVGDDQVCQCLISK
jgi:hypothetical protein